MIFNEFLTNFQWSQFVQKCIQNLTFSTHCFFFQLKYTLLLKFSVWPPSQNLPGFYFKSMLHSERQFDHAKHPGQIALRFDADFHYRILFVEIRLLYS